MYLTKYKAKTHYNWLFTLNLLTAAQVTKFETALINYEHDLFWLQQ